ncbi:hypothetical protein DICPUDRAFT_73963 [Dictyostelium purpureum]|uniref:EGF-like domain-containing protein n=1 Tax=Dictyostelium purpureum TaxID=5786 RepID=F0Z6D4_DICPU|nr:uncharacterized protein DICPUDRAFT_73963 [Dictyostelium purpureum]EGC40468.1 hypothetical protein DICPUDRAFT_73963 [Dictyostelium purpureum]|eukprot:XP_003283015.1 hypothetical protein DICPUDRAFT_73963 [Dictyostelium purpureum]
MLKYKQFFKSFILLILLQLISFNNLVCSEVFLKDVSPPNTFYKFYSNYQFITCQFAFEILCIPQEALDTCNVDFSSPEYFIGSTSEIFDNSSAKVTRYVINYDKIGTNYLKYKEFSIEFQCLNVDLDKLSFELIGDYYTEGNSISGVYRINGLDPDASFFYFSYNSGQYFYSTAFNSLRLNFNSIPDDQVSQILVNISTPQNSRIFSFKSPFGTEQYTLSIDRSYPNEPSLENYDAMGYNYGAVLSLKVKEPLNKLFLNSLYSFEIGTKTNLTALYIPVSSDETGATTILTQIEKPQGKFGYDLFYRSQSINTKVTPNTLKLNFIQYPSSVLPWSTVLGGYENGLPIVTFGFSEIKPITDFTPFYLSRIGEFSYVARFPYGYIKSYSNPQSYDFQVTSLVKPTNIETDLLISLRSYYSSISIVYSPIDTLFVYDYKFKPSILDSEIINLGNGNSLLRLTLNIKYGFKHLKVNGFNGEIFYGAETFVSGDLYGIGYYELIAPIKFDSIYLSDQASFVLDLNTQIIKIDDINNVARLYQPPIKLDMPQIKDVSFLYNDIDVSNHRYYNVMYFNYSENVPRDTSFAMLDYYSLYLKNENPIFYSSWNESIKKFQIIFYIEANSPPGSYQFFLFSVYGQNLHSSSLSTQLLIKKTKLDNQGPLFKEISKILPDKADGLNVKHGIFGWTITIEDQINGFKNGYIVIKGQIDQSHYNISLSPEKNIKSGNLYLGVYDIKLNISFPCITQNYVIDEVKLTDRAGRISYFSIYTEETYYISLSNPFLNYIQDSTINKIKLECEISPSSSDITPPTLVLFKPSTSQNSKEIDVSKSSTITFDFKASDPESGLKNNTFPIVYISNSNNQMIECYSEIKSSTEFDTTYKCTVDLPLAFGYPGIIIFSVYGFINNNGLFSGYSTKLLITSNFDYYATTTFNSFEPVLTGNIEITDKGGNLWLYGKSLSDTDSAYIKYDGSTSFISLQPSTKYSTTILIPGIKPTNKPYQIYVSTGTTTSNTIKITPVIYDSYFYCNGNGIQNISTCICNNKWTTIITENQCTIPNHYISSSTQVSSTTGGEITLNGWFGTLNNNATLFIDNKPLPFSIISSESIKTTIGTGNIGSIKVNFTQNTITWSGSIYPYYITDIECSSKCHEHGICDKTTGTCKCNSEFTGFDCSSPIINNNNNQAETETEINNNGTVTIKNQEIGYSIFIDSITELDLNNQQITIFNLSNNWILANKQESVTTFNQIRINEDNSNAIIKLIIEEVNNKDKDFTFAGNQFTVTKGGFKLSLSISNWLFKSNLNTLQVQMTSDIQIDSSNSNNKCNKDDNEATIESSSNNNYLMNNINYLKVIKNNRILYARFQDKMLSDNRPTTIVANVISNDKKSIKIALNLPHCDECLIDPDFSLLISPDYNFECKDSRKWVIGVAVSSLSVINVSFYILLFSTVQSLITEKPWNLLSQLRPSQIKKIIYYSLFNLFIVLTWNCSVKYIGPLG